VAEVEAVDKSTENCDPSYTTVCIHPRPIWIAAIFLTVVFNPPVPHRFDGDHDGIECEKCLWPMLYWQVSWMPSLASVLYSPGHIGAKQVISMRRCATIVGPQVGLLSPTDRQAGQVGFAQAEGLEHLERRAD